MSGQLTSLSKNMLIYGGGLLLKRMIGFVMIPFYTHYLRPADYGLLEILDLTGFIAAFFIGFGVMHSVFRFHAAAESPDEQRKVKSNGLLAVATIGGPVALLAVLASPLIARVGAGDPTLWPLVALTMTGVFFSESCSLLLALFRVENRPLTFAAYSIVYTLVNLTLNIVFLAGMGLGVLGILLSGLITAGLFSLILLVPRLPASDWKPDAPLVRRMLAYCMPFIPTGLMAFTVNFADRYFLRVYGDMATVGVYSLGYKFGMVGGMLIGLPFNLVWSAQAFEIAKGPDPRGTYGRVMTYYVAALLAVCTTISVLAREIIGVMATPDYFSAASVVPLVAWGILCLNLTDLFQVGILLEKRTVWLPVIWGGSTVVNLGLNYLLIPKWGMMGAAWSTMASFLVHATVTHLASNRFYRIHPEWFRVGVMIAASLAVQWGAASLPPLPLAIAVASKAGFVLAAVLALLLVPGFVRPDERAFLGRAYAKLSGRSGEGAR